MKYIVRMRPIRPTHRGLRMILLQQMLVLFIYMLIGYFACKKGKFDDIFSKKISWLVVEVANNAMIISAAINSDGSIKGKDFITTLILAVAVYAVLMGMATLLPLFCKFPAREKGIYQIALVFNNIGFMGYPIISAVYGSSALLYAVLFSISFNVLIYTYGIRKVVSSEEGAEAEKKKGSFLNVGVLCGFLALFLYIAQLPMPQFIKSTASGLSNLTSPLSMMVIGISLCKIPLRKLFSDWKLLVYCLAKLLVLPIVGMLLINRIVDNQMLCHVCMIILATPAASMVVMLAEQYDGNEELAARIVALSTLLSVITIPVVSAVVF